MSIGNDEGDDTPAAPVKTVDKTSTHTVKRNTDGAAPAAKTAAPATGGRRGGAYSGNEAGMFGTRPGSSIKCLLGEDIQLALLCASVSKLTILEQLSGIARPAVTATVASPLTMPLAEDPEVAAELAAVEVRLIMVKG